MGGEEGSKVRSLGSDVEHWSERYTEEQHERALDLLSERDRFECIIEDYSQGRIIIHTPYVSSEVVEDFCLHFGYRIEAFGPVWPEVEEHDWPCMPSHGAMFEVQLAYDARCRDPIPLSVKFIEDRVEHLSEADRQF